MQAAATRLTDGGSDEERQTLQTEHDRIQRELDRVTTLWASTGAQLDANQRDAAQIVARLEETLRERFGRNYPNISFAPGLLAALVRIPYATLIAIERQVSLLQFDPVKVNFQSELFTDAAGQEIRVIAADSEYRLYTTTEGSTVFVRGIGTQSSESEDVHRLQSSRL